MRNMFVRNRSIGDTVARHAPQCHEVNKIVHSVFRLSYELGVPAVDLSAFINNLVVNKASHIL